MSRIADDIVREYKMRQAYNKNKRQNVENVSIKEYVKIKNR